MVEVCMVNDSINLHDKAEWILGAPALKHIKDAAQRILRGSDDVKDVAMVENAYEGFVELATDFG